MTEPRPEPTPEPARAVAIDLADGEWHRVHPLSPLLRGGLVLLAVLGVIIANLRERAVDVFIVIFAPDLRGYSPQGGDPMSDIVERGYLGIGVLAVGGVLLVLLGIFWLMWRMHTFRITNEAVEVRKGVLFRTHRSARLDRIQGINVSRPLFPRVLGTAKLDVSVAGQSGNVELAYLKSRLADQLRAQILRLASGARAASTGPAAEPEPHAEVPQADAGADADAEPRAATEAPVDGAGLRHRASLLVSQRADEFLAPELDADLAPPESVVHLSIGRVIGSTVLGVPMVLLVAAVALISWGVATDRLWVLFSFVPALIGIVGYGWSRVTKSLRYSIAGTPDGVRIGHGLLATSNQTIPPGRVHAIRVSQSAIWRIFGWWMVRINVAGQSVSSSGDAAQRTLVLPVGSAVDVARVIDLLAPESAADLDPVLTAAFTGRGGDGGLTPAPARARWAHPLSVRRVGAGLIGGTVLIRSGWFVRDLTLVPLARMQSVCMTSGPVRRRLRLASMRLHTVAGPVVANIPAIDADDARDLFERIASEAVERAATDTSHHWGTR